MSGSPQPGHVLTCTDRDGLTGATYTWEIAPRPTHFENDANWFPIQGAAGSSYVVQPEDAGSRVRCHEYGTKQVGPDEAQEDQAQEVDPQEDARVGRVAPRRPRGERDVPPRPLGLA